MSVPPIAAIGAADPLQATQTALPTGPMGGASFSQMLLSGIDRVDQKLVHADAMAKAFALDDSIPLHQVTFALEEARLSLELMLQVRSRLVEGYQQIMGMQL